MSSIRDITWYFSAYYRSVSDITQQQVWRENSPPKMGESVIGAILFQTVFDTAAMDFYTAPGLCGSWLVWFLACVWLWMKWTRVLSSCHIVFVVCSDHFHRKSRTQASSTSDIFIKLLIVQWICIWYTKNLLSKLLDLIVKNTKNLCKRLIPSTFLMYRTVINQHTHVWTYSWIFCIIWQPQNSGCHNLLTSHLMANYWRLEWYTQ